jgi:putative transcriptional regulator
MLSNNIKEIRKAKGLSQEELAIKLNVVRQTISKWENGLSVPDSEMLISISKVLETSVSTLLGEDIKHLDTNDLKTISKKLEIINEELAHKKLTKQKFLTWLLVSMCIVIIVISLILIILKSPYLNWDYNSPETAVMGVGFHAFEWLFVRLAPVLFIGAITGIFFIKKRK